MRAGFQAKDPRQKRQMTGRERNRSHLRSLVILAPLLVVTGCKSGPEPVAEPENCRSMGSGNKACPGRAGQDDHLSYMQQGAGARLNITASSSAQLASAV
jgi:hypothetical protein